MVAKTAASISSSAESNNKINWNSWHRHLSCGLNRTKRNVHQMRMTDWQRAERRRQKLLLPGKFAHSHTIYTLQSTHTALHNNRDPVLVRVHTKCVLRKTLTQIHSAFAKAHKFRFNHNYYCYSCVLFPLTRHTMGRNGRWDLGTVTYALRIEAHELCDDWRNRRWKRNPKAVKIREIIRRKLINFNRNGEMWRKRVRGTDQNVWVGVLTQCWRTRRRTIRSCTRFDLTPSPRICPANRLTRFQPLIGTRSAHTARTFIMTNSMKFLFFFSVLPVFRCCSLN